MDGDSGIAPTTRASGWIGPWPRAPGSSASIAARSASDTNRSQTARTICFFSCITCHTRTGCSPGRRSIQYIYDSHYDGAAEVVAVLSDWDALKGRVDDERFNEVRAQLEYQAGQAIVWRDAVTRWFQRASGVADDRQRVNNYPGRIEAESATLNGYVVKNVTPWETASGDRCGGMSGRELHARRSDTAVPAGRTTSWCSILTSTPAARDFASGLAIASLGEWTAADRIPTRRLDGSSSSRRVLRDVVASSR